VSTRKNGKNGVPLALQFIANCILKQKELIVELKQNGRSTKRAEAVLENQLRALAMLHNHCDLSLELSKPNAYEKPRAIQAIPCNIRIDCPYG
jgi:hypothetical protein